MKIAGARSLSDKVAVTFASGSGRTTDVHLLAYNDFHGTLDPASQTLYGQFAGGAAYLAKAIKDRQATYGREQATISAGDNIGASQLANGLFHEEPATIVSNLMHADFSAVGNHEFDKGSAELLRIQNGGCHPDGCTGAPYALAGGGTTDTYPARTSSTCRRTSRSTRRARPCSPPTASRSSRPVSAPARSRSASSVRC